MKHNINAFRRERLPIPCEYHRTQRTELTGGGVWRNAVCPFHSDTRPSLRINIATGAFRCMVCGTRGGDVLAFHMQRYGLGFVQAAKELRAWEDGK